MYDFLIVGAGFFGATFARLASDAGKKCLVIDKRYHVGGNAHSEMRDEIAVHVHGPHIFHCESDDLWKFVNRFANFNDYVHRVNAKNDDKVYSMPINLQTLNQIYGVSTSDEARFKLDEVTKPYRHNVARNLEEWALQNAGPELYEALIKGYTTKQWARNPIDLPSSIIKRLPIRLTWNDNYFDDKYQGIPVGGYTPLIENMLQTSDVRLGVNFLHEKEKLEKISKRTVYTGPIDEFYNHVLGDLEYRSLRFEHKKHDTRDHQGMAQLNWTNANIPWTRTVEHRHFDPETASISDSTIVTKEYPREWTRGDEAYYPINDSTNQKLYNGYCELAMKEQRTLFGGRLGTYRYMDMAPTIASAMKLFRECS